MGEHEQNDICKEKFRQFDKHVEESAVYRDALTKIEQRTNTLERDGNRIDNAISALTQALDGIRREINSGVIKVVSSSAVLALGVCITVGVYINKVDTIERAVEKLENHYDHPRLAPRIDKDKQTAADYP